MSFALFLLYVLLTFVRLLELFAPDLAAYRPMLVLWGMAFVPALFRALSRKEIAASGAHFALLIVTGLAMMASQLAAGWMGGALKAFNDFLPNAMLFLLVVLNVTSLKRLRMTCVVMVAALVMSAALGINAYHTGKYATELVLRQNSELHDRSDLEQSDYERPGADDMLVPARDKSGWYLWRVRGMVFFSDPNDFAQALVMALPLLWGSWALGGRLRRGVLVIAPSAVIGYAILLSQSRGALVGLASMLFFSVRRLIGTTRTALLLGAVLILALIGNLAGGRAFSTQERSAEERIEAWVVGIQLLKQHPVFGAGYGSFLDHNYLTAHNSYVLCFAEIGLFGYFAWLGLIVLTFKGLERAVALSPPASPEAQMTALLRSSLLGFLTCAWFLSRTYQPVLYFVLALCTAAWWIARKQALVSAKEPGAAAAPEGLVRIPWARHTLIGMVLSILAVSAFVRIHTLGLG